jgi:hypothetical protein
MTLAFAYDSKTERERPRMQLRSQSHSSRSTGRTTRRPWCSAWFARERNYSSIRIPGAGAVGLEYTDASPLVLLSARDNYRAKVHTSSAGHKEKLRPNNSFNRTRYGKRRKPGLRHLVHHLRPGLRHLPPRAG